MNSPRLVRGFVLCPADASIKTLKGREPSDVAKAALQALSETLEAHGERMPETSTIPEGIQAVRIDQWWAQFGIRYGRDGDRKADTIGKAFRRAKDQLPACDKIAISDPYVWLRER